MDDRSHDSATRTRDFPYWMALWFVVRFRQVKGRRELAGFLQQVENLT